MTNAQWKKLVAEAVALHREIAAQNERLKKLKANLVRESRFHKKEFTLTDNGDSRWTVTGTDGCIARVNFPAPTLRSLIDSESETFEQILALSGKAFGRLLAWVNYLCPIPEFREEAAATLPDGGAAKLIELCQITSSPRVSFETAQGKNSRGASAA